MPYRHCYSHIVAVTNVKKMVSVEDAALAILLLFEMQGNGLLRAKSYSFFNYSWTLVVNAWVDFSAYFQMNWKIGDFLKQNIVTKMHNNDIVALFYKIIDTSTCINCSMFL